MPIAENFPEGLEPIGKINYSDGDIAACIVYSNDECKVEICPPLETAFHS